jgi:hypothetical protein
MVAQAVNEGFVKESDAAKLLCANESHDLLALLQQKPSSSAGEWWKT